jgi:hypothetical protein
MLASFMCFKALCSTVLQSTNVVLSVAKHSSNIFFVKNSCDSLLFHCTRTSYSNVSTKYVKYHALTRCLLSSDHKSFTSTVLLKKFIEKKMRTNLKM